MFDEDLCQQGKNFVNKIWNAYRLIDGWEIDDTLAQPDFAKQGLDWYQSRFNEVLLEIEDHYSKYRLSDVLMTSYKLIWDDFCSWLLEIIKPDYQQPIDAGTHAAVIILLEDNLRLMHPFIPFITEEIWQSIAPRKREEALVINQWPEGGEINKELVGDFEMVQEIITGIRKVRKEKQISFKNEIDVMVMNNESLAASYDELVKKMVNVATINSVSEPVTGAVSFRVRSNEYFIPLAGAVDATAELYKLEEELKRAQGFLISVQKKLSNERFVANAAPEVVDLERQKEADALAKIETIKASMQAFNT
jgi:valyl-tRNA synthetase